MDLSITARGVGERGLTPSIRNTCSYFRRLMGEDQTAESRAAPNTTHTGPFLYIYLQNVLKFSVQCLADEARQILHASLALFFAPRANAALNAEGEAFKETWGGN